MIVQVPEEYSCLPCQHSSTALKDCPVSFTVYIVNVRENQWKLNAVYNNI